MSKPQIDALIAEMLDACAHTERPASDRGISPPELLRAPYALGPVTLSNRCLIAPLTHPGGRFLPGKAAQRFYLARAGAGLLCTGPLSGKSGDVMEVLKWCPLNEKLHARGAKILLQLRPDGCTGEDLAYLAAAVPAACFDGVCLSLRENDGGALEYVRAVRTRLGARALILCRASLSPAVWESGLQPEKGRLPDVSGQLTLLTAMAKAGVDAFEISIGSPATPWLLEPASKLPPACFAEAARALKAHFRCLGVRAAVAAFGRLDDPAVAEALLRAGDCDLISLDGAGISDPGWCKKLATGEAVQPAPLPAYAVEPGQERIAVIGAGCRGLSYAILAADAGHRVELFEAEEHPGGKLALFRSGAAGEQRRQLDWLLAELGKRPSVTLHMGTRADAERLKKGGYDRIVFACSAAAIRAPSVPGWGEIPFVRVDELDRSDFRSWRCRHVVVLGGDAHAADVAWMLQSEGLVKRAVLMTESPEPLPGERESDRAWLRQFLPLRGGEILCGCRIKQVKKRLLLVEDAEGREKRVLCDKLVLAEERPAPLRLYEEAVRERLAPVVQML